MTMMNKQVFILVFSTFCLKLIVSTSTPKQTCFQDGLCIGHLIEVKDNVFSKSDCLAICKDKQGCKFASFHSKAKTCTLSKACSKVVLKDQPYQYSSIKCQENTAPTTLSPEPITQTSKPNSSTSTQEPITSTTTSELTTQESIISTTSAETDSTSPTAEESTTLEPTTTSESIAPLTTQESTIQTTAKEPTKPTTPSESTTSEPASTPTTQESTILTTTPEPTTPEPTTPTPTSESTTSEPITIPTNTPDPTTSEPTTPKPVRNVVLIAEGEANWVENPTVPHVELFSPDESFYDLSCQNITYPEEGHYGAVSGLIDGIPIVCGGITASNYYSNACQHYSLEAHSFKLSEQYQLPKGVRFAAYAQWKGDKSIIIAGGQDSLTTNSDLIQIVGDSQTWTMETVTSYSCMVNLQNDEFLLTGGIIKSSEMAETTQKTFVFTPKDDGSIEWHDGPTMLSKRSSHMCGILKKESKSFVVVSGGLNIDPLNQCEYLEIMQGDTLTLSEWKQCDYLGREGVHVEIKGIGRMLTDPQSGDIYAIGKFGGIGTPETQRVYRLSDVDGQWTIQSHLLQIPRDAFAAMVVPETLLPCS